jgi:hypothetical protein
MSSQGVILIDLMAIGFIILILNLVRRHTLIIGHVLIYFSVQLSIMFTRQIELMQTIAMLELKLQEVENQTKCADQITNSIHL